MRRSHGWLAAALLLLLLANACSQEQVPREGRGAGVDVGERAPAFELPAASGGRISLADFDGRPVLLYFSMGPG